MKNKPLLKTTLYILLPVVFFMALYSIASFYYMDFNPNTWDKEARLLIAMEGLVAIALGVFIAWNINNKK